MATTQEDLRFVIGASVDLKSVSNAVSSIISTINTTTIANLVRVASPMTFDQWAKRLADIQGVIGQALTPVLEIFTDAARLLGDVLASMIPNATEVRGALSAFRTTFAELGKEIRDVMNVVGPIIREALIDAVKTAARWLAVLTKALAILTQQLVGAAKAAFGPAKAGPRTALGAAATPARISSFEEYEKNLQVMFASQGKADPAVAIARDVAELLDIEAEGKSLAEGIKTVIDSFVSVFEQEWPNVKQYFKDVADVALWVKNQVKENAPTAKDIADGVKTAHHWYDTLTAMDPVANLARRVLGRGSLFGP